MDTQLKKAFEETLEARIISTVPDMPEHRFSPQFERKMKRLAGGGAPKKLTVRRLFICVTAAIIAAALAASSVSAVRDFFKSFLRKSSKRTLPSAPQTLRKLPKLLQRYMLLMFLWGLNQRLRSSRMNIRSS